MENCWLNPNGVAENALARRLQVDNGPQPRHEPADMPGSAYWPIRKQQTDTWCRFEKRGGNVDDQAGKGTILRMYSASVEPSSR